MEVVVIVVFTPYYRSCCINIFDCKVSYRVIVEVIVRFHIGKYLSAVIKRNHFGIGCVMRRKLALNISCVIKVTVVRNNHCKRYDKYDNKYKSYYLDYRIFAVALLRNKPEEQTLIPRRFFLCILCSVPRFV